MKTKIKKVVVKSTKVGSSTYFTGVTPEVYTPAKTPKKKEVKSSSNSLAGDIVNPLRNLSLSNVKFNNPTTLRYING